MKVLVSGASGGIGKAICLKFLENGHEVIGMDVAENDIKDDAYKHIIHDIRNTDYPVIENIEALINCAGVCEQGAADIDVNLTATISFTEHYAFQDAIMSVLTVASSSALTGSEFPEYAASKGGIITYTRNVAIRIAKYGACANSICPGAVITDFNQHILDDKKMYDAVANESLLKKWAEPEEMADWAYFLVCVNKSMTGQHLLIDNGEAINYNFIW